MQRIDVAGLEVRNRRLLELTTGLARELLL